ncbi:MAG: hypothetical protein ACI9OD_003771 [Limisphaerales bacterium]|jgi:hypothetical protein
MKDEKTSDREDQNSFKRAGEGEPAGLGSAGGLMDADTRKEGSFEETGPGSRVVNRSKGGISVGKQIVFSVVAALIFAIGIGLIGEIAVCWASPQPSSGSWRIASDDGLDLRRSTARTGSPEKVGLPPEN